MIVVICFKTFPGILNVDIILGQTLQDLRVYWYLVDAHNSSSEVFLTLHQVEPRMLSYIVYFIALIWICVQNASYQVFSLI